jgi:hypothetical protein
MVWTEITRRQYRRDGLRYESDTMDAVTTTEERRQTMLTHPTLNRLVTLGTD